MKELLKVYIFTTVFSDRYAISKINGFKFHCPCMKHSASILFIFFSIFFYYAFMFSRFRLVLFLTWSILIAMETGRTVTATWYTWLVSKKNHPNLLQNKIVIRNNLLKAWSFWSPRMLKESIYTLHSTWILTSRRFPIAGDFKHQYFYREIKGKDFMLNKTHNQERISQWSVFFSKL